MTLLAHRANSALRNTYLFPLPISDLLEIVEIPDPAHPFPGNRRVSKKHALEFGDYWERNPDNWIIPPVLLDTGMKLESYKVGLSQGATIMHEVVIPVGGQAMHILDGQHRILGWYLKRREMNSRLEDRTSLYNKLILSGDREAAHKALLEIEKVRALADRLQSECVSVQLVDQLDGQTHRQYFVDIAKNALGINKTVQSKFDSSSIVNRVAQSVIETHKFLRGRVDMEKTSCSGTNENLLSVVNVADIVRHCCFGISTRVTARREAIYDDDQVLRVTLAFIDTLLRSANDLQEVASGALKVSDLRKQSLLASSTVWRGLAGGFYEACVVGEDDDGTLHVDPKMAMRFEAMLGELAPSMRLPISRQWTQTKLFADKASKAPSSRTQDLKTLSELIGAWAQNGSPFDPPNARRL